MKHTNPHFDAIRGLAALLVVAGHLRAVALPDWGSPGVSEFEAPVYLVTGLGDQAVVVFFVLSGYLVGGMVWRTRMDFSLEVYLVNRGTRILIVAWPAVVLGLLVWLCISADPGTQSLAGLGAIAPDVEKGIPWLVALGNFAFLQPEVVPAIVTNGPLWSLGYEVQFYLLFPLLVVPVAVVVRFRRLLVAASLILGVAVIVLVVGWPGILYFGVWLLGALLVVIPRIGRRIPVWPAYSSLGVVVITASILSSPVLGTVLVAISAASTIWATSARGSSLRECGALLRLLRWLGVRSYSIYAYHFPLIILSAALLKSNSEGYGGFTAIGVLAFLGAVGLYQITEAHTDRLRLRLRRPVER